jgi:hypothetical protein
MIHTLVAFSLKVKVDKAKTKVKDKTKAVVEKTKDAFSKKEE